MVIIRKIAEMILSIDDFGQSIGFKIKGNEKFYTYPGSFATILCNIIVLAYGYSLAYNMFTNGDSSLSQNLKHNFFSQAEIYQPFPPENQDTIGFNIAFNLLTITGEEIPEIEKYFTIKVVNEAFIASADVGSVMNKKINKQLDPSFVTVDGQYYRQKVGFHKCNVYDNTKFFMPNENYIQGSNKVFSKVYCLDDTSGLLFYGNYNTDLSQVLKI